MFVLIPTILMKTQSDDTLDLALWTWKSFGRPGYESFTYVYLPCFNSGVQLDIQFSIDSGNKHNSQEDIFSAAQHGLSPISKFDRILSLQRI